MQIIMQKIEHVGETVTQQVVVLPARGSRATDFYPEFHVNTMCVCMFPLGSLVNFHLLNLPLGQFAKINFPRCDEVCEYLCVWCLAMDWHFHPFSHS